MPRLELRAIFLSLLSCSTGLTPWERLALEAEIGGLDAYTRHTSRFLVAWLTFLPFGLAAIYGWLTIPICGVIAFLLAGVEGIGVSIEHPIRILPIKAYAAGFKAALMNQLKEAAVARELAAAAAGHRLHRDAPKHGAALVTEALPPI
ncbi:hypothetical protein ABPG77_006130 [Micractinium sp. CCAP 211/92]